MSPYNNQGWQKIGPGFGGSEETGEAPADTPYSLPFSIDVEGNIRDITPPAWAPDPYRGVQGVVKEIPVDFFRFQGYRRGMFVDASEVTGQGNSYQLGAVLPSEGWKIECGWRGTSQFYCVFIIADVNTGVNENSLVCVLNNIIPGGQLDIITKGLGIVKDSLSVPQGGSAPWDRPTKARLTYTDLTRTLLFEQYRPDVPRTWTATLSPVHGDVDMTALRWIMCHGDLNSVTTGDVYHSYIWVGNLSASWPIRTVEGGAPD